MADASHLHEEDDDDDLLVSISPQNNHLPHHLDQFHGCPLDLDFFHPRQRVISSSHGENRASFVIDMFHQRVDQSQSRPRIEENRVVRSDRRIRVIEEKDDSIPNEFEVDFGAGSGLFPDDYDNPNCDDDDNSGFIVADSGEDLFVRTTGRLGARSDSGDSSQGSGSPELYSGGVRATDTGSDSDEAGEDCDEEASLQLCWDAFQLEDDITTINPNPNANSNEDFEWETLSMFFGAEPDDDASNLPVILSGFEEPSEEHDDDASGLPVILSGFEEPSEEPDDDSSVLPMLLTAFEEPSEQHDALEWQVLSNVHNFEPDQNDEDNYTEYEMFFGQFADSDVPLSGRPPASKTAVDNLSTVVMTREDDAKNSIILCAVCKDEIVVGAMATQLPCSHRYHGDCILPWLEIRNTCPVCRYELPTDDLDYELRKTERAGDAW